MNSKKAKQIRRQVAEALNVDCITAVEEIKEESRYTVEGTRTDGLPNVVKVTTNVRTLKSTCSRKVYQQFKKQIKAVA